MPLPSTPVRSALGPTINMRGGWDGDPNASTSTFTPGHSSILFSIQAGKIRPADATAYVSGDLIGAAADVVFEFNIKAFGLDSALLLGCRLIRKATTNTATRFRGHVHNAVPASLTNADNALHPLLWTNRVSRRGWVDFANPQTGDAASGNDSLEYQGIISNPQGLVCDPADGIVRMLLSTRDAVTLGSAEEFTIEADFGA